MTGLVTVKKARGLLVVVIAALSLSFAAADVASAKVRTGKLLPGHTMRRGDVLRNGNGTCKLVFQHDQNVVIYHRGRAIWALNTVDSRANRFVMQHDGNLVLYRGHRPLWDSGTWNRRGAKLHMQNDCNLVIYRNGSDIWASNTARSAPVPGGASTYYTGRGDAGWRLARPHASFVLSDNGRVGDGDWTKGGCSSAWADNFAAVHRGRRVTTLAGWSLGRLGPIYALKESPRLRRQVDYVLMFDPGSYGEMRGGCDSRIDASGVLAHWLSLNRSNRLVIMAGKDTADYKNLKGGRAHAGIQNFYFPKIRGRTIARQVKVCNVENNGVPWSHEDVMRSYAWMIARPAPSSCHGFIEWHP